MLSSFPFYVSFLQQVAVIMSNDVWRPPTKVWPSQIRLKFHLLLQCNMSMHFDFLPQPHLTQSCRSSSCHISIHTYFVILISYLQQPKVASIGVAVDNIFHVFSISSSHLFASLRCKKINCIPQHYAKVFSTISMLDLNTVIV